RPRVQFAEHRQRGLQARHADRKSGSRDHLAAKARDEPIIASAAADRTEAHGPTLLVLGLEQQFNLVHGTGVIFEAADDCLIDFYAITCVSCALTELLYVKKLSTTLPKLGIGSQFVPMLRHGEKNIAGWI